MEYTNPHGNEKRWYIGTVISGRELTTAERVRNLGRSDYYGDKIFRVVVPTYQEEDAKGKMKTFVTFATYVFFEAILDESVRYALKAEGVGVILGKIDGAVSIPEEKILAMLGDQLMEE